MRPARPPWRTSVSVLALALASGCATFLPATSGTVLFQDDFSRRSSGWETYDDPSSGAEYSEGALRLHVDAPNSLAWSTPGFALEDVRLDVDTTAVSGSPDNAFGLICRYRDPGNYLFFLISSDGFSGIGAVRDGQRSLLTGEAMLPSDFILTGLTANHMRAECAGPRLSLHINGALANEVTLETVDAGDVGVIVGTYTEPGADIRFDNFTVSVP
jgi:hypothetical protein